MIFFRILLIILFILANSLVVADDNDKKTAEEIVNQAKEITKQLQEEGQTAEGEAKQILEEEEEDVPLNDPFLGNEGSGSSINMDEIPEEAKEDKLSLYNFKLSGLISGKDHSYISLVDQSGDILTLTLGQNLGKIKLVDLRLTEAIFEKEDKSYLIIDFNNSVREADEY